MSKATPSLRSILPGRRGDTERKKKMNESKRGKKAMKKRKIKYYVKRLNDEERNM